MRWLTVLCGLLAVATAVAIRPPRRPPPRRLAPPAQAVRPPAPSKRVRAVEPPGARASGARRAAPLVVLDPGHGGTNTGAAGPLPGVYEKQLTLALARQVSALLERRGLRVELTRDRDTYRSLRQRVDFANRVGADVFVSIHANATPKHDERGFSVFVLSRRAADIDARALRVLDGAPHPGVDRDTALVLDDVERGVAIAGAARLAFAIDRQLRRVRGAAEDRGIRQAPFDVLMGETMPAVLVEVGFVDNPDEGRELLDPRVQAQIAGALARAIESVAGGAARADAATGQS